MQKHSFAHTFRTKIKHGRLKKGGASTANPKKEHHHGGAIRHGILACHPCCHRHCPLCRCRHCSPTNLVTVSIALPPSPSLLLATLIAATVIVAAIALVVVHLAPSSSSLLATLIAATVVAIAIALVVTHPAPSSPSPSLLPPLPAPSSLLATLVAIVIALFVTSAFTCPSPLLPTGIILLADRRRWRQWRRRRGADRGSGGGVGNTWQQSK
jgi:hypothetical protein